MKARALRFAARTEQWLNRRRLALIGTTFIVVGGLMSLLDPAVKPDQANVARVLDLTLPGPSGSEILARLKTDPILRTIPVVVMTTSGRDEDVWQSYQAGANSFIQKPGDFQRFRELASSFRRYWEETAIRPPRRPPTGDR